MKTPRFFGVFLAFALLLSAPAAAHSVPRYIARERQGLICVTGGEGAAGQTAISVAGLPNAGDRVLLQVGLPLYSRSELSEFMENFCS